MNIDIDGIEKIKFGPLGLEMAEIPSRGRHVRGLTEVS